MSVSVPDVVPPGPGLWKLNTFILAEEEYAKIISYFWLTWRVSIQLFPSLAKWWEAGKTRIKGLSKGRIKGPAIGTFWSALLTILRLKWMPVQLLALNHTILLFWSWPLLILVLAKVHRFVLVSAGLRRVSMGS